jgi:cysteine desulfuration protein SufE
LAKYKKKNKCQINFKIFFHPPKTPLSPPPFVPSQTDFPDYFLCPFKPYLCTSKRMKTMQDEVEKEIIDDFSLFDSWEEKYQYIIELGQQLPALDEKHKIEENKIKGCQSSVWLNSFEKEGKVYFEADSDSTFVKGEIALLIKALSGRKPEEIVNADLKFIDEIGLRQHIAITRANGLANMIKQMKLFALGIQR